jgi:hypothetical protein
MNQGPSMEWDAPNDRWLIRSSWPLTEFQKARCVEFMLRTQRGRRLGLIAGDLRDDLDKSVQALQAGRVVDALTPTYRDHDGRELFEPFRATVGTGRIIVGA